MARARKSGRQTPEADPVEGSTRIESVFGEPRNYFDNRLVYLMVSQRARGLSVGVNLNPDQNCNFRCVYCEIRRDQSAGGSRVDVHVMVSELERMLSWIRRDKIRELACYATVPADLLRFRNVSLSGNGEPTLCPNFSEVVRSLVHLRAQDPHSFFQLVLVTNATGLHLPEVRQGLEWFTAQDEVWAKLDAGTQAGMDRINRSRVPLAKVLDNILLVGRQRPVVIQSLFASVHSESPSAEDIEEYVRRLTELRDAGAQIALVQIYSAHRPTAVASCHHLSLPFLSRIAHRVREATGFRAEVF